MLEGRTCPMVKERDVVRNKGGIDRDTNLNRIVEQNWAAILDREIGFEWRQNRELDKHLQLKDEFIELEPMAVSLPPTEKLLRLSDLTPVANSFSLFETDPDRFRKPSFDMDM